jgi:phosphatidate cytidylyltransferase
MGDDEDLGTDPGPAWTGVGASRGPRSPAEGVRIIGAEEAAAALEAGHVSPRVPEDAPRYGDVPEPPSGPRPGIRFPGVDPRTVPKPPVVTPPADSEPRRSVWDAPASSAGPAPPPPSAEGTYSSSRAGRFEELIARADERAAERGIDVQSVLSGSTRGGDPGGRDLGGRDLGGDAGDDLWPPPLPPSAAFGAGPGDDDAWPPEPGYADPQGGGEAWPAPSAPGGEVDDPWPPPPAYGSARTTDDAWPAPPPAAGQSGFGGQAGVGGQSGFGGQAGSGGADFWPPDDGADVGFDNDPLAAPPWDTFDEPLPSGEYPRASVPSMPTGDNSGSIPLPHWTEPATGEVPVILADQPPPQGVVPPDELGSWSNLSGGPRWRDQATDWDEADFHDAILDDQSTRVGALDQSRDDLFSFDEAAEEPAPPAPAAAGRAGTQVYAPAAPAGTGGDRSGGPDADLTTRVIVGLVAAGVVLGAAVIGPRALVFVVAVALTMAAAELFQGLRTRGYQPATLLGLAATASVVGAAYWQGERALPLVTAILLVFSFLWYLIGVVKGRPTMNIAVSVMAYLYVGFLGSYAVLIFHIPIVGESGTVRPEHATGILLAAVLATVAHDIGSYFVGRYAGKTPLAPTISPHKTFEGLAGGTFVTMAVCLLLIRSIAPWNFGRAFALAIVVSIFAPLGDLCESMIKRDLNVKDMGTTLPGHGGILDRIDALLFVIPATYYLALVLYTT